MHQAAGGARPEFDLEHQQAVVLPRPELHLSGLHVTAQGHQVQPAGVAVNDPDGSVPRPGHLHQQFVPDVQAVVAEFTGVDVDHLGGYEAPEVAAQPRDEPGRIDVGVGDVHTEEAVEEGTPAVLCQLHPAVDRLGRELRREVRLVTPALATPVQGRRLPQVPPGHQACTQEPPGKDGEDPR